MLGGCNENLCVQEYNKILTIGSSEGEVVKLEHPVKAEGSVEIWLNSLLKASQEAVHSIIRKASHHVNDSYFDLLNFTCKFQAQIGILGLQILWTKDSEMALINAKSDRKIMLETNGKFLEILNTLIGQTTKNLDRIERRKYETLITVHMHQREIFDLMVRNNVKTTQDFEWLKQVRFYFKQEVEKTIIGITDVNFTYQNEYLGCQERLVITPLTDRSLIIKVTIIKIFHVDEQVLHNPGPGYGDVYGRGSSGTCRDREDGDCEGHGQDSGQVCRGLQLL